MIWSFNIGMKRLILADICSLSSCRNHMIFFFQTFGTWFLLLFTNYQGIYLLFYQLPYDICLFAYFLTYSDCFFFLMMTIPCACHAFTRIYTSSRFVLHLWTNILCIDFWMLLSTRYCLLLSAVVFP